MGDNQRTSVLLSMGSNVGDRRQHLEDAVDALTSHDNVTLQNCSAIFETQPLEDENQDFFLNMLVAAQTTLEPEDLLAELKRIESSLGRKKRRVNGPREIDIDIAFYGESVYQSETLTIPHAKVHERKFVLIPLSHLQPEFVCPDCEKSVTELLRECPDESYIQLYGHIQT